MNETPAPVFILACIACGKTVSGSEKSCPRCGASFDEVRFECPFCGELVKLDSTRCASCGTEFSVFAESVDENSSVVLDGPENDVAEAQGPDITEYECPACGKPVSENDDVCPSCGAKFSEG